MKSVPAILFCVSFFIPAIGLYSQDEASPAPPLSASSETTNPPILGAPTAADVSISGIVTETKKYSFTVEENGKQHTVRLKTGTPIGLRLNKPWFDWKNGQVVVDSMPATPALGNAKRPRVAIKLPTEKLFLISKFKDAGHVKHFMSNEKKRLSFYLVTPEDVGSHLPTESETYIAGSLEVDKRQQVKLNIGSTTIPVQLGFRNATINGFSIGQLEPNKTRVVLGGTLGADGEVIARSVIFEPIYLSIPAATVTSAVSNPPAGELPAK